MAAELAGIHLGRARVSAFVVSAAAAGAAGAVMALAVRLTAPTGFTLTLSLTLLTAVVLGGLGSLTGALLGAALLTFLPSVVTDAGDVGRARRHPAAELAPLVYGLVMVPSSCSPRAAWSAASRPPCTGSGTGAGPTRPQTPPTRTPPLARDRRHLEGRHQMNTRTRRLVAATSVLALTAPGRRLRCRRQGRRRRR